MSLVRLYKIINQSLNRQIRNLKAEVKSQVEHIKLLNQCDDSSTEVIAKMDIEIEARIARIKNLNAVIEHQKEVIERQGEHTMKRHNVLCDVKEVIDEYFGETK